MWEEHVRPHIETLPETEARGFIVEFVKRIGFVPEGLRRKIIADVKSGVGESMARVAEMLGALGTCAG
jgi:hypothetical protein